jgi:molybdate transport system substrate-binding protein
MKLSIAMVQNAICSMVILAAFTMTPKSTFATEIRVLSAGAPKEALATLTPEFEHRTGYQVKYSFAVMTAIKQQISAGENNDLIIMTVQDIEAYVKAGKMRPDGWATLGSVGVVVIVKQGASLPDISTAEHFRDALLKARAVVHATPTATPSGAHMAKVIEQLGIADALQNKVLHRPALDGGVELVANGQAEIGIYPASEVAHVKGVTVVGPLPQALQFTLVYAAAVPTDNAMPAPALALVKFLSDPANRIHWTEAGFDPPGS